MRKMRNLALLVLAVVVIAGFALLPGLVSAYKDSTIIGQTRFETVPNVELQIRSGEETPALGKLAMMCRMDGGLEISESMASMTREEREERALEILQEYVDAGLVTAFEPMVLENRCMLSSVTSDPSLNGIFWMVTIVNQDESSYAQFELAVDDESGAALAVSFTSEQKLSAEVRELYRSIFSNLYFNSLGISYYGYYETPDLEDVYIGENNCAVRYRFGDQVYGEINVDFYVHEYGFYTEFPDMRVVNG